MNHGLYLSAAGAMTAMHKQDVHANNLANVNTVGFKPDSVFTRHRLPERIEQPHLNADPHKLLEQLGGGQFLDPTFTSTAQGALAGTDRPLDVAIKGEGFFVVSGGRNPNDIRLTRDGQFTLNESRELVMASTGLRVLDASNQPIRLDPAATITIDEHGEICQNGQVVARLQIAAATDPTLLRKAGHNLMRFRDGAAASLTPATGKVRQGYTEGSAVDPILTMNAMIGASKAVASNATMLQYHDHIMGQAVNTLGRVS
jgi:flagellar basal-body rod protein FlgF